MRHRLLTGFLILAAPVLAAAPANAAVKPGPSGPAFYTPPTTLPSGPHGTPIWQRKLTGEAVLKRARSNTLLLYRSTAVDGSTVAVSGDVAIPKGRAPKGGWPVISWAHGTVGIADACAPSKVGTQANYDSPLLNRWLKAGYAVVRTDYEGLGTPGPHPYLIGVSEGRSTLDMVRAARRLTGPAALRGGAGNRLLLYRSTSATGKAVAVSGTLTVPKGKAPKGGWPVISWAHGTTGIADQCAPSREGKAPLVSYAYPLLQRWLKAGYAVVRTDYEGLGTPGAHPYLIGSSEGHSVLDAARAARKADPRLGRRVVLAGHSQGGQSVLWAASLAPRYTPDLKVRGTVALAPVSHLAEQSTAITALRSPSGLTGLVAMIVRGIDIARPSVGVPGLLSDRAAALYPQTLTACLGPLTAPSSFGGIAPADLLRQGADLNPLVSALGKLDDPEELNIRTPVQIQQGTADQTVFKLFTDPLVEEYKKRGIKVTYKTYEGVSHAGAVTDSRSAADATKYIRSRFR